MKRSLSIILALFFIFSAFPTSIFAAADMPVISFDHDAQGVYGGGSYSITVNASEAVSSDVTVTFSGNGSSYSAIIKAGETSASVDMTSERTDENFDLYFSLDESSSYSIGKNPTLKVIIQRMPDFDIYQDMIIAKSEQNTYVIVQCKKSSLLTDAIPLSIRADDGTILHSFDYPAGKEHQYIHFTAPAEYSARGSFHLYNDLTNEALDSVGVAFVHSGLRMISEVDCSDKIALTFDCAYGAPHIEYILETLDKYNAKATFFMTAGWATEFSDYVKEIVARGHELGNHSVTHSDLNTLEPDGVVYEITRANELITKASGGVTPVVFRPPYGACHSTTHAIAEQCGVTVIKWSFGPKDYDRDYNYKYVIQQVTQDTGAGDIVLFHSAATHTEKTLEPSLQHFLDMGLQIVTVSDLLIDGPAIVSDEGVQMLDPNYGYVSAADILANYNFEVTVTNTDGTSSLPLIPVFSDEQTIHLASEIEALKNGTASLECVYDIESAAAPIIQGDKVCSAVLSFNGEQWFTVDLTAAQSVELIELLPEETSPSDISTDADDELASDKASCTLFSTSTFTFATVVIAALALAVVVTLLTKKRK